MYYYVVSLKNFMEYNLYHIGYFLIFGPVFNLLLMLCRGKKGFYLSKNMIFWGVDKWHVN